MSIATIGQSTANVYKGNAVGSAGNAITSFMDGLSKFFGGKSSLDSQIEGLKKLSVVGGTISVPNIKTTIAIVKHEAVYRFLDEDLEALPELHKQLLRMGPDNVEKIQSFAKNLRASLIEDEMQR